MADFNREGIVFNIQKFSVNDGPGIRTVVFLKGCPLHCKWCSNPESQLAKIQILHSKDKCMKCRHCIEVCPKNAITLQNNRIHINHSLCNGCKVCYQECPADALQIEGKKKTVSEVMKTILQDKVFYEESNGGMTVSGGELFMQWEFAKELFIAAKEEGIHTCCETTAFVSNDIFLQVLPYIDFLYIDIKHWNSKRHLEATGVSNQQILANVKSVIENKKEFLPRIPVIPGFNDSLQDAMEFSSLFNTIGINQVQLLPFHQFGENKYDLLDSDYAYANVTALHPEDLQEYLSVFQNNGIHAFF